MFLFNDLFVYFDEEVFLKGYLFKKMYICMYCKFV